MATIRFEHSMGEDTLSRSVREFSRHLSANLCSATQDFFNHYRRAGVEDHPLRHDGKSLQTLLAAAVAQQTPIHLAGVPSTLTGRKRPKPADRVAVWCHVRDIDMMIDIEQCPLSLDRGRKTETVRAAWQAALAPVAKPDAASYGWTGQGVRLGLLVVQPYSNRAALAASWNAEQRDKLLAQVRRGLGTAAAFVATWDLPKAMRVIERWPQGDGSTPEFCPLIVIAGAWMPVGAAAS